jgi:hypothetical protein
MQANKKRKPEKRLFTVEEANATLPLLRSILRDVTELAREVRDRHERLGRIRQDDRKGLSQAHDEELEGIQGELERARERMEGYEQELRGLGVELKDYYTGLVDFPCRMDGREVYLCWRLGEPEVAHWHELDAGFAGRQRLLTSDASKR